MTNFTPAKVRIGRRKFPFTSAEAASAAYRAIIDVPDLEFQLPAYRPLECE